VTIEGFIILRSRVDYSTVVIEGFINLHSRVDYSTIS
jgi:hypothetical protein